MALSEFIYFDNSVIVSVSEEAIFINAIATEAPRSSKTIETVVEVGIPSVLKKSNNKTSVTITAIKIIIISSKNKASDKVWGLRQGAVGYITKPFSEDELLEKIRDLTSLG